MSECVSEFKILGMIFGSVKKDVNPLTNLALRIFGKINSRFRIISAKTKCHKIRRKYLAGFHCLATKNEFRMYEELPLTIST